VERNGNGWLAARGGPPWWQGQRLTFKEEVSGCTHLASIDQVTSYDMPADHLTPVGAFGSISEPASPSLAWEVLT
jgi:hypothetical protein